MLSIWTSLKICHLGFVLNMVENIVGKGENAGHQHFLLYPKCLQNLVYHGIVWYGLYETLLNSLAAPGL